MQVEPETPYECLRINREYDHLFVAAHVAKRPAQRSGYPEQKIQAALGAVPAFAESAEYRVRSFLFLYATKTKEKT
jgi:hypothetical protein